MRHDERAAEIERLSESLAIETAQLDQLARMVHTAVTRAQNAGLADLRIEAGRALDLMRTHAEKVGQVGATRGALLAQELAQVFALHATLAAAVEGAHDTLDRRITRLETLAGMVNGAADADELDRAEGGAE